MTTDRNKKVGEKVNLDSILVKEVGQFGRFQWLNLALAALPTLFFAFVNNEYIFTTARTASRCLIPECDHINPEFVSSRVENAIPRLPSGAFDQCSRFPSNSSQWVNGTCPASLFDSSTTEPCDQYVYENTNTIVYDFDLACAEWKRSSVGSVKIMGSFVGLSLSGYISDRWGRRVALLFNVINSTWLGLTRSFISSYEWFVALEFIESTLGSGAFTCCYILVSELAGPKYRVLAGVMISTALSLGQVALGFISWAVPDWRTLIRILYGPQILILCYLWLITESIRWLLSKGRFEEAEKILKKLAQQNKKILTESSLTALRASAQADVSAKKAKGTWLPILVFQFIFAFLPEGMDDLSMAVYLVGKSCIAGVALSVYVYTAELYPTKHRHQLFAFSSTVGRIGTVVATLTPALAQEVWVPLPSVLFGSCALLSALLILTTPETLGTKLPETMADAENISKNKIII